jgi:hypothetical protein
MDPTQKEQLIERLARHPHIYEHVLGLLDEVENRSGTTLTADDAEGKLIERMREMGNVSLNAWAKTRCESLNAKAPPGTRRSSKKKLTG